MSCSLLFDGTNREPQALRLLLAEGLRVHCLARIFRGGPELAEGCSLRRRCCRADLGRRRQCWRDARLLRLTRTRWPFPSDGERLPLPAPVPLMMALPSGKRNARSSAGDSMSSRSDGKEPCAHALFSAGTALRISSRQSFAPISQFPTSCAEEYRHDAGPPHTENELRTHRRCTLTTRVFFHSADGAGTCGCHPG